MPRFTVNLQAPATVVQTVETRLAETAEQAALAAKQAVLFGRARDWRIHDVDGDAIKVEHVERQPDFVRVSTELWGEHEAKLASAAAKAGISMEAYLRGILRDIANKLPEDARL